jgi:hypothetical protein
MKNFRAPLYLLNHAAAGVTLQNKAYPMRPMISRMPSGVSRQLKAYPMRPFCIQSLSHAVRCLATAESIPYVSFLHPLSLRVRIHLSLFVTSRLKKKILRSRLQARSRTGISESADVV